MRQPSFGNTSERNTREKTLTKKLLKNLNQFALLMIKDAYKQTILIAQIDFFKTLSLKVYLPIKARN